MSGKNSTAAARVADEHEAVASGSANGSPQRSMSPPTPAQVLGDIVFLAMKSPDHRHFTLAELEQAIIPALMLRQFRLWRNDTQPIAFASWVLASDEVAERLEAGERRLAAADWNPGQRKMLVDLIAPFGGREGFERALREMVGGGK